MKFIPQMSSLLWFNLYIYSLLMLLFFIVMIYYFMIFFFPLNEMKLMKKFNKFVFKW